MERILVTGGAGFIGSHLVDLLLATEKASVLVFDNFRLGKREHLEGALSTGRLTVLEGDIRSADDLRQVADFEPDTVFHLAALHFVPYCKAHPQEAVDVNVLGLDTVIRALRPAPLRRFVFASSAAVYEFGDERWRETSPARPGDIYGISKWMGEHFVAQLHADRPEVRTAVNRLFNVYGPRETNPHVLPDIMAAIREGRKLELGNLWPQRDFTYVADTARALVTTASGDGFDVFNVGTGTGTTVGDVLATIETIRGEPLDIWEDPARQRPGDGHLVGDPRKLMAATGWRPEYDLKAGIRALLASEGLL